MRTQSELILNPDGSIYHLALHPEQIAETIILVGDQHRVPRVSQHFDQLEHTVNKREFVCHTGILSGKRLSVISTGIGTDNIDIVLQELDALFNIDLPTAEPKTKHTPLTFVRIGTAGTMRSEVSVGSTVASSGAIAMDNLLHYYPDCHSPTLTGNLQAFLDKELGFKLPILGIDGFPELLLSLNFDYTPGYTVTCPGFYGPQGRQLRVPLRYPDYVHTLSSFEHEGRFCANFEMETSGIYGLSHLLGHQALSLSAILANRANGTFAENPYAVIDELIQQTLTWLVSQ